MRRNAITAILILAMTRIAVAHAQTAQGAYVGRQASELIQLFGQPVATTNAGGGVSIMTFHRSEGRKTFEGTASVDMASGTVRSYSEHELRASRSDLALRLLLAGVLGGAAAWLFVGRR